VVGFQPCIGSTGDDTPIHLTSKWKVLNATALTQICGDPDCAGPESKNPYNWWHNFTRRFANTLATDKTLFGSEIAEGKFALLLNEQGASFGFERVATQFPGSFVKFGQAGHEYQSNYERYRAAEHAPYIYSLQTPLAAQGVSPTVLRPIRSRAELSAETCWTSSGEFFDPAKCPVRPNVLAMARWVAAVHLDYWNIQPSSIQVRGLQVQPV
jgi:hypothetical protein